MWLHDDDGNKKQVKLANDLGLDMHNFEQVNALAHQGGTVNDGFRVQGMTDHHAPRGSRLSCPCFII